MQSGDQVAYPFNSAVAPGDVHGGEKIKKMIYNESAGQDG